MRPREPEKTCWFSRLDVEDASSPSDVGASALGTAGAGGDAMGCHGMLEMWGKNLGDMGSFVGE